MPRRVSNREVSDPTTPGRESMGRVKVSVTQPMTGS